MSYAMILLAGVLSGAAVTGTALQEGKWSALLIPAALCLWCAFYAHDRYDRYK